MSSFSIFARLRESAFQPQHPYRTSLQAFPDLEFERIYAELDLSTKGPQRGTQDLPTTVSAGFDEVELGVIERIAAEHKAAHGKLSDELVVYSERLNTIDIEARSSEIRHAIGNVQTEFRAEASQGRDDLNALRRKLKEAEREKTDFQARFGITRAARTKSAAGTAFSIAVLAFVLLIETWVNGTFLSVGNEAGLIGGFTQAFSFAALNVVVSFALGLLWLRFLYRPGVPAKLWGFIGLVGYLVFAVGLNLGLAHFRDIAATGVEGGQEALTAMAASPFGLRDINSWAFFGIGMTFSAIACLDGLFFSDPFPGYGAVEQRRMAAHDAYISRKESLMDRLRGIRDDANEQMKELQRDLGVRRNHHDATLSARAQMVELFRAHERQLEMVCNLLLQRYREANQATRSTKPPKHFSRPWTITPLKVEATVGDDQLRIVLRAKVDDNQKLVDANVALMHAEFDKTVDAYRLIDEMVDDEGMLRQAPDGVPSPIASSPVGGTA